jgi:hypothetical protein
VAAVQYTFTHKQYRERHNETEYQERNRHDVKNNNKDTCLFVFLALQTSVVVFSQPGSEF